MRLLLVEDDSMIGEAVLDLLRAEQYAVDWARDGDAADTALRTQAYDLVLLDLGLPKRDGLAVLRDLRARKNRTPVLVATARDAVAQRIEGLDAGADDYVLKPFSPREVAARVRSILRRVTPASPPAGQGALHYDEARQLIHYQGQALPLTRLELRLLACLLAQPQRVFSREQLLEACGVAAEAGYERNIDSHIKSLRAKLRQVDPASEAIVTHRGLGYSLRLV